MKHVVIGFTAIFFILIAAFSLVFVNPTGMAFRSTTAVKILPAWDESKCVDSDGGMVLNKTGTTRGMFNGKFSVKSDYCVDTNQITEFYCGRNANILSITKKCNELGTYYLCNHGICVNKDVAGVEAKVLNIPLPENSHCFWSQNQELSECSLFYKQNCGSWGCQKIAACSKYYNPVYDSNGTFYPSACWAEQLGVKSYTYGYSEKTLQFMRDLWYTQKNEQLSYYQVPNPEIEFSYEGAGLEGLKGGVFLSSFLWKNSTDFIRLDFNINTNSGKQFSTYFNPSKTSLPVFGTRKALLVFMPFDDAYPQEVLFNWSKTYEPLLNDYFQKKQLVPNPVQFSLTPVKIDLPFGIKKPMGGTYSFSESELKTIYDTAIQKAPGQYQIFIISPIFLNGYGGYQSYWNNMQVIESPLIPYENYSSTNQKQGLDALGAFQNMMNTISHELLHAVGLSADHFPMGYGTTYLSSVGQNVDKVTGKEKAMVKECDFFSSSPDHYAVEIPVSLKVFVGKEPSWLTKEESSSGPCLNGVFQNDYLKEQDKDGEYEIMYSNNPIGIELQRSLGWVDIDNDGKTELIDPTPYGGYKEFLLNEKPDAKIGGQKGFTFTPLGEIVFEGCKFEKVKLEDGQEGLIPLKCEEFITVNVYPKLKYNYDKVQKSYGTVFLPKLS